MLPDNTTPRPHDGEQMPDATEAARGTPTASAPQDSGAVFDARLLRALQTMAARSPRFQADVQAAMRHAGLDAHPAKLAASLQRLEMAGSVSNLIQLSDGGLLVTVAV